MVTTSMSPAAAASDGVAARARGPSSSTNRPSVRGPRELLNTTSYPAATPTARPRRPCVHWRRNLSSSCCLRARGDHNRRLHLNHLGFDKDLDLMFYNQAIAREMSNSMPKSLRLI